MKAESWSVVVPANVETKLPNGQRMLLSGMAGNFEVHGFESDQGPVVEVVSYQRAEPVIPWQEPGT